MLDVGVGIEVLDPVTRTVSTAQFAVSFELQADRKGDGAFIENFGWGKQVEDGVSSALILLKGFRVNQFKNPFPSPPKLIKPFVLGRYARWPIFSSEMAA